MAAKHAQKRPMAKVRRVGLFAREVIEHLSIAGVEAMLSCASRLSEGQLSPEGHYFGSTMVTLDLRQLGEHVKDAGDLATSRKLAALLARDERVLARLAEVGENEARRVAGRPLSEVEADVRVRAEGAWVFIDIDVEAEADHTMARSG